jgi:chemotaxis protein methyltransferase CheR
VFAIIGRVLLPALSARKQRLHIWCAGCSSGEEAYSLAILLHEHIATHPELSGIIYATDIDETILKKAREGIYEETALEHVSQERRTRYFSQLGNGRFAVQPLLKGLVRFRHHDLMGGETVARFLDLITCRNVTIYFTESQKNDLARRFHGSLASEGYYVMGKTEYMGRDIENLFAATDPIQKVYRKRG